MTAACAQTALLVIGHGERSEGGHNKAVLSLVARLRGRLPLGLVTAGVLRGEPSLERALDEIRRSNVRRVIAYPFFMSDGYFVRTQIPARLRDLAAEKDVVILDPLGRDPALPDIVQRAAVATASAAGLQPSSTQLLIVGHGSKLGPASSRAARAVADVVARSAVFESVEVVFLEEAPFMLTELASAVAPVVLCGFFASEGLHATVDIGAAILETGRKAYYTGPIGIHSGILDIIETRVRARAADKS